MALKVSSSQDLLQICTDIAHQAPALVTLKTPALVVHKVSVVAGSNHDCCSRINGVVTNRTADPIYLPWVIRCTKDSLELLVNRVSQITSGLQPGLQNYEPISFHFQCIDGKLGHGFAIVVDILLNESFQIMRTLV